MAKWYKTDGTVKDIADKMFELKELQEFVDGWIELVHLDGDKVIVVNEEGFIRGLQMNPKVSEAVGIKFPIYGNALVVKRKYIN